MLNWKSSDPFGALTLLSWREEGKWKGEFNSYNFTFYYTPPLFPKPIHQVLGTIKISTPPSTKCSAQRGKSLLRDHVKMLLNHPSLKGMLPSNTNPMTIKRWKVGLQSSTICLMTLLEKVKWPLTWVCF